MSELYFSIRTLGELVGTPAKPLPNDFNRLCPYCREEGLMNPVSQYAVAEKRIITIEGERHGVCRDHAWKIKAKIPPKIPTAAS